MGSRILVLFNNREDTCLQALLLIFKRAKHRNKIPFVSTANEALVGTLMTIGDVEDIFPTRLCFYHPGFSYNGLALPHVREEFLLHTLIFQLIIEITQVYNTTLGKLRINIDFFQCGCTVAKGAEAFELATAVRFLSGLHNPSFQLSST